MNAADRHLVKISELLGNLIQDFELDPDEDLLSSGKLTSLTSMNLIVAMEDSFGITIPNNELNRTNFTSLRSLAHLVHRMSNIGLDKN